MATGLHYLLLVAFVAAPVFADESNAEMEEKKTTISGYVDKLFDQHLPELRQEMVKLGMDPMDMPGFSQNVLPLPGYFRGKVNFSNGWVQGLSMVRRTKHIIADYSEKRLTLTMNLGWNNIDFDYEYDFKYMLFHRKGNLLGHFENMDAVVVMSIDLQLYELSLESISFYNVGKYDLKLQGHLADPMFNAAAKVLTTVFRSHMLSAIEYRSQLVFRKKIEEVNENTPKPNPVLEKLVSLLKLSE